MSDSAASSSSGRSVARRGVTSTMPRYSDRVYAADRNATFRPDEPRSHLDEDGGGSTYESNASPARKSAAGREKGAWRGVLLLSFATPSYPPPSSASLALALVLLARGGMTRGPLPRGDGDDDIRLPPAVAVAIAVAVDPADADAGEVYVFRNLRFRHQLNHDDKYEDSLEANADSLDSCKARIKFASTRVHRYS